MLPMTCAPPAYFKKLDFFSFLFSGQDVVKMDVQPKCLAVGPGGYAVIVCIGEVCTLKTDHNLQFIYLTFVSFMRPRNIPPILGDYREGE